jgi:hypothetical protein
MLEVEPTIYQSAQKISEDFKRGDYNWILYTVSNGSFYMSPSDHRPYRVISFDFFDGYLSADAFGLASSIFAYSQLSYNGSTAFIDTYADMFYKLKQVTLAHPESETLLQATNTLSV